MTAADGKKRKIQVANAKGLLRIIQSIPSPKAEPFKDFSVVRNYRTTENPKGGYNFYPPFG